jgi:Uma2 family endonuclease
MTRAAGCDDEQMGEPVSALDFAGPWTVEDLAQVEDDLHKYEIIDGSLLVNPSPTNLHQGIRSRLFRLLVRHASRQWDVLHEPALRIADGCLVPDLGVVRGGIPTPPGEIGYDGPDVALVVEVVSPSSRSMDRVLKPMHYAAAGVPWYWRVETDQDVEVIASQLADGVYVERTRLVGLGTLPGPFPVTLDTASLGASRP